MSHAMSGLLGYGNGVFIFSPQHNLQLYWPMEALDYLEIASVTRSRYIIPMHISAATMWYYVMGSNAISGN